jgi:hypothetical protein
MTKRARNMRHLPPPPRQALPKRQAPDRRGSTAERGYGPAHRREREKWRPRVEAGQVLCARCHTPIGVGQRWHLDHTADRKGYLGPSHASCNLRARRQGRSDYAPRLAPPKAPKRAPALSFFDRKRPDDDA